MRKLWRRSVSYLQDVVLYIEDRHEDKRLKDETFTSRIYLKKQPIVLIIKILDEVDIFYFVFCFDSVMISHLGPKH